MKITGIASGSSGNSYIIQTDKGNDPLLIEAGLTPDKFKKEIWDRGIKLKDIKHCLISHRHQDHYKAAEHLTKRNIDILLPKYDENMPKIEKKRRDRFHYTQNKKIYKIGKYVARAFELEHDGIPINGYFIKHMTTRETIFYTTDTMYIKYKPSGVNYFMIEVNYQKKYLEESVKAGDMVRENMRRIMRSHMGLDAAVKFFKSADLSETKEIYVLHHSQRNSNPVEIKEKLQAETGLPVYVL